MIPDNSWREDHGRETSLNVALEIYRARTAALATKNGKTTEHVETNIDQMATTIKARGFRWRRGFCSLVAAGISSSGTSFCVGWGVASAGVWPISIWVGGHFLNWNMMPFCIVCHPLFGIYRVWPHISWLKPTPLGENRCHLTLLPVQPQKLVKFLLQLMLRDGER